MSVQILILMYKGRSKMRKWVDCKLVGWLFGGRVERFCYRHDKRRKIIAFPEITFQCRQNKQSNVGLANIAVYFKKQYNFFKGTL